MQHPIKTLAVLLLVIAMAGCSQSNKQTSPSKAEKIHQAVLTVDTHTDTPLNLRDPDFDLGERHNPDSSYSRIDLPRMEEGQMDASFFAVYVGQRERTPESHREVHNRALSLFESIRESVGQYPEKAAVATNPKDAYRLEKENKRAVYIGVENGYALGGELANVKKFYDMGARYITLCHTSNNDLCDSSTDDEGPEHNGLSDFGEDVVKKMNELGMIIDVSHISDKSFYDVLEVSEDPIMASHSCARALRDHPRNLSDEMLLALKEDGGVIQICLVSSYLKKPEPQPKRDSAFAALREKYNHFNDLTEEEMAKARKEWRLLQRKYPRKLAHVKDIVDHIDHVVKTIGIDYVGIGTDFDGGAQVNGCRDVSEIPNITRELVKRGYTREEIEKIWGGNFMRVFREVNGNTKEG
ncbi:MAG TPA: dipeptidase [Bacteroidales bacterium]|nr:dipeptidase [Bacteroidales bacterium]